MKYLYTYPLPLLFILLFILLLSLPYVTPFPFPTTREEHWKYSGPPRIHPPSTPMNMSTWMSHLSPHTYINTLSIPGTHDTMAFQKGKKKPLDSFTITQAGSLSQQLQAGVRFVDMRCRHYRDVFEMHHGIVYLHTNFTWVVHSLYDFLSGVGKDEVVIMRLKDEGHARSNTRKFAETLENYVGVNPDTSAMLKSLLWFPTDEEVRGGRLPLLGDVRGKIIVLGDYPLEGSTYSLGVSFNDGDRVKVQDFYKLNTFVDVVKKKWNAIVNFWREWVGARNAALDAHSDPQDLPLLINFLSGASLFHVPSNVALDKKWGINNRVQRFLRTAWETVWDKAFPAYREEFEELRGETMGIVVWDFINTKAARLIVSFNFRGDERFDWSEVGYKGSEEQWEFRPWN